MIGENFEQTVQEKRLEHGGKGELHWPFELAYY